MKTLTLVLFLSLLSTAAFAGQFLEIDSIRPDVGSINGGDLVLIDIRYQLDNPICDPISCEQLVQVYFGDVPARSVVNDRGLLRAITPAHAKGTVPVTVTLLNLTATRYTYRFVDIQDASKPDWNYDRVLLPVAVSQAGGVQGAYGSIWKSELWVTNRGEHPVEVFVGDPVCIDPVFCAGKGYPLLAPGQTKQLHVIPNTQNAAYLVYVQKGGADDVVFSLRVRDVSRTDDNHGTEVPVPREDELHADGATILNVPIDDRSRTALRIYNITGGIQPLDVPVKISTLDGTVVASKTITLQPVEIPRTTSFLTYAAYAMLGDLRLEFPELPQGTYRIDLEGPVWGLASVTNNRTQLVTAIGPQ